MFRVQDQMKYFGCFVGHDWKRIFRRYYIFSLEYYILVHFMMLIYSLHKIYRTTLKIEHVVFIKYTRLKNKI